MSKKKTNPSQEVYRKKLLRRRKPNRSIAGDIVLYLFLVLLPKHPTLDNFSDLFVTMGKSWVTFTRYLFNTIFITFMGTFGHLLVASMAAFVLAKYEFPGGNTFFKLVTVAMMFTGYVTQIPNYISWIRPGR